MVAKASAKTPPRQRSKFSSIFDALVATPQVKTSRLPEVRRTAVAKTPDEEFYDLLMLRDPDAFGTPEETQKYPLSEMLSFDKRQKAPQSFMQLSAPQVTGSPAMVAPPVIAPLPAMVAPAMAAPSAMRMHSGTPNVPSRQPVPFDPSLPFDPSMPIGVASMPGRRPAPASVAPERPPEKRMDTLLRGIGNFLGYIPQGGSRGDRTELIADFARGLLGEKPIREEEAELNQRMAGEMLRRALATGDVDEIARLDPDMAMKLQEFGTFDEDYANTRQTRLTQKQIDDAAIEENRILQARRVVEGLYEATEGDPQRFAAAIQQIAQEQPNIFNSLEVGLASNPDGMRRYFAVASTSSGSAPKPMAANIAGIGDVMVNAAGEPVLFNGQYVRPTAPLRYVDQGAAGGFLFPPYPNPDANSNVYGAPGAVQTGVPTGAPGTVPDVTGQGFPPPPGIPVGAPVAGGQPGLSTVPRTTEEIAAAEAQVAGAKAGAETRARLSAEIVDQMKENEAPLAAFLNAIEAFEMLPDEDIDLITGTPTFAKAARGGAGGLSFPPTAEDEDPAPPSAPGTAAARVAVAYKEVASKLRLAGFNSVKGAGQVTQAESKFAAEALGALRDGRWSSTEDLMNIINRLKTTVILAQQTQQARLAALRAGDTEWAMQSSDEAIEYLRAKYAGAQQPRAVASPQMQRNRVPAPNSGAKLPRATNDSTGEAMVYRDGQWVPE